MPAHLFLRWYLPVHNFYGELVQNNHLRVSSHTSLQITDNFFSFSLSNWFLAASAFKVMLSWWHDLFELPSDQCDLQEISVYLSKSDVVLVTVYTAVRCWINSGYLLVLFPSRLDGAFQVSEVGDW